ncbi:Phospholipid methyltransferase [Thermodesulfobium acidiphilum]|uniref:Phospholipid methyltransferase n=1 Tax=Thermodesulfobium acidiphilum TaxID=1794699 RepID=A0A2R4VZY7_THEAF|nr:isoprenylcysteine carboxylmethyltransferase family protein [Thermodesulfobium acidiphilum]AWB10109.1 Phospholipid methyltransferase [Thermodesulfobium acidiphilum]
MVSLIAGAIFSILGLLLRAWAAATINKVKVLSTDGPYSLVRNPLYLGSFLAGSGVMISSGSFFLLVIFVIGFLFIHFHKMKEEEEELYREHKEKFLEYKERVPAFLPNFLNFKMAPISFKRYMANNEYRAPLTVIAIYIFLILKYIFFN